MARAKKATKKVAKKKAVKAKNAVKKTAKSKAKKTVAKAKKTVSAIKKAAKPAAKKATSPLKKIKQPFNKSQLIKTLEERTGLAKKDVSLVMEELTNIINAHIEKGSAEQFVLPGMMKIMVKKVAAKPARKGINPFTGEETMFKAKPASRKVKVLPLKKLKEMVA